MLFLQQCIVHVSSAIFGFMISADCYTIPCSAVGTWLDDTSLRIAVSLRLGANMCAPHTCVCGVQVDSSGTHGLACRKSAGRNIRHNAVNQLIKRALASASVPAMLEPNSLSRDDGKRPDGLTVMPWANGRCLVWDFTCSDTLAASHLNRAVVSPGAVADFAERRKSEKYRSLSPFYSFTPIAVETLGALGAEASRFFRVLGQRITAVTGEPRSFQFLMQQLSVTVQLGNAACILGTVPDSQGLDDISTICDLFLFTDFAFYFLSLSEKNSIESIALQEYHHIVVIGQL